MSSSQAIGRSSSGASIPCGTTSPAFLASAVRLVSSPSTMSAGERSPSSFSRPSSAAPSPAPTKRTVQPHAFSKLVAIAGPGPHSETKLS